MIQTQSRPATWRHVVFHGGVHAGQLFCLCRHSGRLRRVSPGADQRRGGRFADRARSSCAAELARMQNLTNRLSDDYLDIDLLDEQLRDVLGYLRADEVVIR